MTGISSIRNEYSHGKLDKASVHHNPVKQFTFWLNQAIEAKTAEPTAMVLSTSTPQGMPSSRVVLLKGTGQQGLIFFTHYESKKSKQVQENPNACALFFWPELERQVRVEGLVKKLPPGDSDNYFESRPENSKIGSWASPQSQIIPNKKFLEKLLLEYETKFKGKNIPRPPQWGGFILQPALFEFWQGRPGRLHDRLQYTKKNTSWAIDRLAP